MPPFESKSNSYLDMLLDMTTLLNDAELHTLADKCQNLITDRERAKREELRHELMGNLQKAISDILHNGFSLYIKNTERDEDDGCEDIYFEPEDIYHIEIE